MITVFGICKTKHAANPFDGEGAFLNTGRWNSRGTRMVYTAASLALAALEMLVNVEDDELLLEYSYATARVDPALIVAVNDFRPLPVNWSDSPAPVEVQQIGDEWVRQQESAVLEVPTSVIPLEKNYLINPNHPDFKHIILGKPEKFSFDERLK